jgi:hypothetical protein
MNCTTTISLNRDSITCRHLPPCPSAQSQDRLAARVVSDHLEQGWELLCNGVVVFDDSGAILPDGRSLPAPGADHTKPLTASA